MKKIYSFLFLLPALYSSAQITLTEAAHGINPGNYSLYYSADTTGITPGAAGAMQTWNFSSLSISGTYSAINYLSPSATSYASSFPTATVASDDGSSDYIFYTQTATDLSVAGSVDPSTTMTYTNPEIIAKFPFTYGNTSSDTYAGSYSGTTTTGTMNLNADAYGTLILPSGTYNTLRVKSTEQYTDVSGSFSITVNVTIYCWYTATDRFPIMQHIVYTGSGGSTFYHKEIIVNAVAVGIDEASANDHFLNAYPNPAHSACTLNYNLDAPSAVTISLTDIVGKELLSINKGTQYSGSQSETLDLNGIAPGMYIVKLQYGNKVAYKKVQVD